MSAEEWERIKRIFEQALNVPEPDRDAYVDEACGPDADARRTVRELLDAHKAAGSFMDQLWARPAGTPVFSTGQLVAGRFRIVRLINRGGMGEVYEAFDEKLRLRIALKTLRPEFAADKEALRRFEREIRVARQVTHRSLCRVYDLIEHRSEDTPEEIVPCLSMQLLDGESLHSYLQRHPRLTPDEALPMIRQIAEALEVLHENGIVHRDLKPGNIMVVPGEGSIPRVVVTDFGLAKPLNAGSEQFESQFGFKAGAPYYMAPELLRGAPPSVESDLYAFGLVIDEMVTDTKAFPAITTEALLYQRLSEAPVPPSLRAPDLPPRWERAILRCLAADPGKRYKRAGDVVQELEGLSTTTVLLPDGAAGRLRGAAYRAHLFFTRLRAQRLLARRSVILTSIAVPVLTAILWFGAYVSQPLNTSVVVFPLENLTTQTEYNYLCKGTGFELMSRLARVSGIRVIPYYEPRSQASRIPSQGEFSVSGYLQNADKRVRLVMQLTDNRDGALVWTDQFDRHLTDHLQLQLDIAERTVQAIENRILFGDVQTAGSRGPGIVASLRRFLGLQKGALQSQTNSSAALDLYMRGRYLWEARTVAATLQAIEYFKRALEEDPQFALAWAALSEAQFVLMDFNHAPLPELLAKAREYAERAIAVNPELADGYVMLAALDQMSWQWRRSESSYVKAIQINPKHARAHRWYAGLLVQFRRFDEAVRESQQAIALDPYEYSHRVGYGLYLYYAGRYNEAVVELERLLAEKDMFGAHIPLGYTYALLASQSSGSQSAALYDKAFREAGAVRAKELAQPPSADGGAPVLTYSGPMHALFHALRGERAKALSYIDELLPSMRAGKISPVPIAQVYTVLGDSATALNLLEAATQNKDRQMLYVNVSPLFAGLRQSDRFQSLLRSMQL